MYGTSSKYGPSFIAQFSTNQLALSPGSPAPPSNSGDEVKFVLHGSRLTWYTFASVVCVEAVLDTTSLHVKHIGAGPGEAMVWHSLVPRPSATTPPTGRVAEGMGTRLGLAGKTSLMARLH